MNLVFRTVPEIVIETGGAIRLGEHAARYGRKALLITDPGIMKIGLANSAIDSLRSRLERVEIHSSIGADPTDLMAEDAIRTAQAMEADLVIGFGGGSSMDIAKIVAALAGAPRQQLADVYGVDQVEAPRALKLIQAPTTAGTGSEVTPISILTTGATTKSGIVDSALYADMALLDAELTLGLPPAATAATGVDAMVHAIEAYTSAHRKNLLSDNLARQALALLHTHLPRAVEDGSDIEARRACLIGAMLAGQAFGNAPVAAVHALAYPLGGHFHIPHGLSNALVLQPVLRFNMQADAARTAYGELGAVIGGNGSAEDFLNRMQALCERVGMAQQLRAHGISHNDLPMLAAEAMKQSRLLVNNPRSVSVADALEIYNAVW